MPATGSKTYRPLSLSIRLRADGFSFFVCDLQTAGLIRGEHFERDEVQFHERLAKELARPEYLNPQIAQAYVLVDGPTTYVPLDHFRRDEANDIYRFTIRRTETDLSVGYTILPTLEVVELYALPREVEDIILQFHPTARFFARTAELLERLVHYQAPRPNALHLYQPDSGTLFAAAIRGDAFCMANTYEVSSQADTLYFALNLWNTLGMNAATDSIVVIGHPTQKLKDLQNAIAEYLPDVSILTPEQLFPAVALTREKQVPLDLMSLLIR